MNARVLDRTLIYGSAIFLAIWVLIPFYLIAISAFTPPAKIFDYPKSFVPTGFSTDTMRFIILVTGGVFVAVSHELEEAAQTLGCTRWGAFVRVALPLALPGLAAAAIFTFVISWNEVFAATILTLRTRTLPAQVLAGLGTSPLGFKFAGGLFMAMPAVAFIFLIRRYLMNLWGSR